MPAGVGKSNLRVGDWVRLLGREWEDYGGAVGQLVRVDRVDVDRGQAFSDVGRLGSLTTYDNDFFGGDLAIEVVSHVQDEHGNSLDRVEPSEAQLKVFKDAWEAADRLGLTGSRTRAGLIAVLNYKEPE